VAPLVVALVGCSESIENRLSKARSDLEQDQKQLADTESVCKYGPEQPIEDVRKEALAEWDAAAGENLENISPEQEWEIRKSLGAEMGLAPSEVNGWKDIYRSRAEHAKQVLKSREENRKLTDELRATQQKAACDSVQESRSVVNTDATSIARLERELKEHANAPGFFTYLGYGLGALVLLAAAFVAWAHWYDGRTGERVAQRSKQIRLDGLLRQAQIFQSELSAARWQEIVEAHATGDVAGLSSIVREYAPAHLKAHIL
jgi:hypothetical protein